MHGGQLHQQQQAEPTSDEPMDEQTSTTIDKVPVWSAETVSSCNVRELAVLPNSIGYKEACVAQSGLLGLSNQTEISSRHSEPLPRGSPDDAGVDALKSICLASADVQVEDVALDESPEYRYVSEADTEQIPIRREGTVLFMEGGKIEFLAGTVSETMHISPPVHMMFGDTLPSEHGDGVRLHSLMAFGSHEAKFRRPVQVEIDVPRIAETDQVG
ncbi:uncharacterized protein LOC135816639 [Sycon ciliatum]|uniref:uncharacterized protein LOC135816639 n=1 Tax=Sycon ciliatum TaxID=27933 RepID=UPI0031F61ACF